MQVDPMSLSRFHPLNGAEWSWRDDTKRALYVYDTLAFSPGRAQQKGTFILSFIQ